MTAEVDLLNIDSIDKSIPEAAAPKFTTLINELVHSVGRVQYGIEKTTDTAADLEEVDETEKVKDMDNAMKNYIDLETLLNAQKTALERIQAQVARGDKISDLVGAFKSAVTNSMAQYETASDSEKYFRNEKYKQFREKIWEVNHADQVMPALEGEEDDELVIGAHKVSYKCPITTTWLEKPMTSQKCKHSFSGNAIVALIRQNRGQIKCPIPGCNHTITSNDLKENKALAKKVEKARVMEEDNDEEMADSYVPVD